MIGVYKKGQKIIIWKHVYKKNSTDCVSAWRNDETQNIVNRFFGQTKKLSWLKKKKE